MCSKTIDACCETMDGLLDYYDRLLDRAIALSSDSALERALAAWEAEQDQG